MSTDNSKKTFYWVFTEIDWYGRVYRLGVYRPVGYQWALLFNRMRISPNQVTLFSIFLGVAAGIMFYFDNLWYNVLGMGLLIWANMYDSADGQLARMTGQKSEIGRILDGVSGDFWFISIYAAICLINSEHSWYIWALAAITGYFHGKQAAMADYYRNIHLFFLKGKSGKLDNSQQQRELFRSFVLGVTTLWRRLFFGFYGNYTAGREKSSPCFQQFFAVLRQKYGETIPENIRQEFRNGSLPLMKYTNILSFNTRVIVLSSLCFMGMPWVYFVFELTVLNIFWFTWWYVTNPLCSRLLKKIKRLIERWAVNLEMYFLVFGVW